MHEFGLFIFLIYWQDTTVTGPGWQWKVARVGEDITAQVDRKNQPLKWRHTVMSVHRDITVPMEPPILYHAHQVINVAM